MKSFFVFERRHPGRSAHLAWALALLSLCAALGRTARAQVRPAGDKGGVAISVGALASGAAIEYGNRKMWGVTAVVDADTRRRIGIEGEARWLEWHQREDVHLETYSLGARYHFDFGPRFEPYVKGLAGLGNFNFPYNLATGRYAVFTAGGGLDYRLKSRISIRAADFEYQDWPWFTYGNMTVGAFSAGIRVRVF